MAKFREITLPNGTKKLERIQILDEFKCRSNADNLGKYAKKQNVKERFEKFVDKKADSECWEWTGNKTRDGYGKFYLDGKTVLAHRVAYILYVGTVDDKKLVLHKCDNPSCVNYNHLFIGTNIDNIHDKIAKGRCNYAKGVELPQTVHGDDIVNEVRKRYENGEFQIDIATDLNISKSHVCGIINNYKRTDTLYKIPIFHRKPINIEKYAVCKLNWDTVNEIRELWKTEKYTITKLSEIFNISIGNCSLIVNNKTWKDIEYQKWLDNK